MKIPQRPRADAEVCRGALDIEQTGLGRAHRGYTGIAKPRHWRPREGSAALIDLRLSRATGPPETTLSRGKWLRLAHHQGSRLRRGEAVEASAVTRFVTTCST